MKRDLFAPPRIELASSEHAARRSHLLRELPRSTERKLERGKAAGWIRRRSVLVVAVVAAFVVTTSAVGLSISVIREDEALHRQLSQRPLGQPVQVASANGWSLVAWRSDAGLCLDLVVPGNGASDCGIPVKGAESAAGSAAASGPQHEVGYVLASGENNNRDLAIGGAAALDVRRVVLTLSNGEQIDAQMFDAPDGFAERVRFFFADVAKNPIAPGTQESPLRSIDAYDAAGHVLEQLSVSG